MNIAKRLYAWYKRPNKSVFLQYLETFIILLPFAFIVRTYFYGLYQVPTGSMEVTMLVGERFFADKFSVLFYPPVRGDIIAFNDPNFKYSANKFKRLIEKYLWGPTNWTKRVVGVPGDHVKGMIEDGKPVIYINGEKLVEPYVNPYPLVAVYREGTMPPWNFKSFDKTYAYDKQPFYVMNHVDVMRAARVTRQYGEDPVKKPYEPAENYLGRNVDIYDIKLAGDEYWVLGDNRRGSQDSRFFGPLKAEHIHGKIKYRLFSIDSNDSWLIFDLMKNPIDFFKRIRWSRFFQRVR